MSFELTDRPRPRLRERLRLLRRIAAIHYNQPATALWRLAEVEVVLQHSWGAGRGLDIGCGDGSLAAVLFENDQRIRWSGLDIDTRDAIGATASGRYEGVVNASANDIPFADDSFDIVFSNSALEHMPGLPHVLGEVSRVLRPGGRFVFTVPVSSLHDNLLWPRLLRFCRMPALANRYIRHLDRRVAHINYLSPSMWSDALAAAGLIPEKGVRYLSRRELGLWETLANLTGGLAVLLFGGGKSPRDIQKKLGADRPLNPRLGDLVGLLLLPFVIAGVGGRRFSALMAEARKPA